MLWLLLAALIFGIPVIQAQLDAIGDPLFLSPSHSEAWREFQQARQAAFDKAISSRYNSASESRHVECLPLLIAFYTINKAFRCAIPLIECLADGLEAAVKGDTSKCLETSTKKMKHV